MSDHDTADRALVERLQAMYARCVFQRPCDEHEAFKEAAAALARRIAEGARLKEAQRAHHVVKEALYAAEDARQKAEDECARWQEKHDEAKAELGIAEAKFARFDKDREIQLARRVELERQLGEAHALLRSACAIAERAGSNTAWERFIQSVFALGLNGVTARTYRVLPSDRAALVAEEPPR